MSKENVEKLDEAGRKATANGVQHFVATLKDGKLLLSGSQNFVVPLLEDEELFSKLRTFMLDSKVDEDEEISHASNKIPEFALLPCSPFSPQWKGSANIRKILREMLIKVGFKASGRKKSLGSVQLSLII